MSVEDAIDTLSQAGTDVLKMVSFVSVAWAWLVLCSCCLLICPSNIVYMLSCVCVLTLSARTSQVHTHDGAAAACMLLAYGSAKDRKRLVKAMKGG